MAEQLYFAYGSNMNLDQMEFRCPAAAVKENVRLDGYRLAFCVRRGHDPAGAGEPCGRRIMEDHTGM